MLLLSACDFNTKAKVVAGTTMGTTYSITQLDGEMVSKQQIDTKLKQINAIFSTWDKNSELSLLNRSPINQWIAVSDELFFILIESIKLHQKTQAYFNPGLGRLIDIWGFGAKQVKHKPNLDKVSAALKNSAIQSLQLQHGKLKKTQDIHINLSAIVKGYALDEIAKLLSNNNSQNFLVEIGGEAIVRGRRGGKLWVLGIEHPNKQRPIAIKLTNQAIATSGNYRNYFVWQGKQYMHILDPNTGFPANTDLASVSVLHSQTMIADVYATAMMAMGSAKAIALAKRANLSVILIFNQSHGFKVVKINL